VIERRSQVGANVLEETSGRSPWRILLDQFTNIMLLMLIAVAVVSGVLSRAIRGAEGRDRHFCDRDSERGAGLLSRKSG
jgi:magnesium-transporting ATPase (P-type)